MEKMKRVCWKKETDKLLCRRSLPPPQYRAATSKAIAALFSKPNTLNSAQVCVDATESIAHKHKQAADLLAALPISCNPIGKLLLSKPQGKLPGKPARLTVIVIKSVKYILSGSAVFPQP